MRRRSRWILLGIALIGAGFAMYFIEPREPEFDGKRLSVWLEAFDYESEELVNEAVPALREMGTNAVPPLIKLLKAQDSNLKKKLIQLSQRQSLIRFHFTPACVLRARAILACEKLGAMASPAIRALTILLTDEDRAVRRDVERALESINAEMDSTQRVD